MRPWRSRLGVDRVTVDEIGPALLVRAGGDRATALTAMTSALPPEPGRIAIVTAPSVAVRSDHLQLVGQIIDDLIQGDDIGVRLVALGHGAALSAVEPQLRALSDDVGRTVVAPLGSLTVAADGTLAAAAPSCARGGWVTYAPGEPPLYEPAWFPQPAWASDLPPETAGISAYGAAATYPVPAGYWILQRGVTPGRAGAASTISPDPTVATVFLGGFGEQPLALEDVALSLAALPMPDRYQLVLLPGALRAPEDAVHLREYCDPSVRIVAAVPFWSAASAWSLASVEVTGSLTTQLLTGNGRAGFATGPRRVHHSVPIGRDLLASGLRDRGPMRTGVQTAAGWSLVTESEPVGVVPTPAGFVFEVNMDANGFRVHGRSITPGKLAGLIAVVCPPRCQTVVVVVHGTPPSGQVADSLFGVLATALGRTVIAADSAVSMSRTGLLHTSGTFCSWRRLPGEPGIGPQIHVSAGIGDTLPPLYRTAAPGPSRSASAPRPGSAEPVDAPPQVDMRPAAKRAAIKHAEPRWVTAGACNMQDRLRLRQLLDGKYETHARMVVHQLFAEQDSHGERPSAATVTGLIALRAYCATERDTVNEELRGAASTGDSIASTLIAECAMYGLRHLPIVSGPVFATYPIPIALEAYKTGAELVEPAFVDVKLSPDHGPGLGIDYHIWSLSARKLGSIASDGRATAMFAAGSRFLVLGTEDGRERPRVMLLELAPPGDPREGTPTAEPRAEDVVETLRSGRLRTRRESEPNPEPLAFPVGLDDSAQPYQRRDQQRPVAALPGQQTIVQWRRASSFGGVPGLRAKSLAQAKRVPGIRQEL
jgi:hypothetical protein